MTIVSLDTQSKAMPAPRLFTWQSTNGLTLVGVDWPAPTDAEPGSNITVLCLPGLSRNTRDFDDIAAFLQANGHRVIALDYRGRGRSEWDPDWANYTLPVEAVDIDRAIAELNLDSFAVLGTSRGGLHALAMVLRYPADRMKAVIFNDIGPNIETDAIQRIADTLGKSMEHDTFESVATALKTNLSDQFPAFDEASWMKLAHQLASDKDGKVVLDYDPALANHLANLDHDAPPPDMWPLYALFADRAVLVVRGETSDLLTLETSERMLTEHPGAALVTVPGQGHVPVLWEEDIQQRIAAFLQDL